ncbi:MAG: hypothetical protein M3120_02510 [Pseudomonadota bacterium]|nr:hypothetical protein [Pseudomonadota bacterium]
MKSLNKGAVNDAAWEYRIRPLLVFQKASNTDPDLLCCSRWIQAWKTLIVLCNLCAIAKLVLSP